MSLVTSCPECATSFLVKPEQLSAHRGEVRCGKCGHVFNALDRLGEASLQPPAPESLPDQPTAAHTPAAPAVTSADFNTASTAENPKFADITAEANFPEAVRRKFPTWAAVSLAVILLMLAIAQTTYYMRTPISAHWPALKPYLVQTCNLLNCTVELPQLADQLEINDSDLQEDAEHLGLIHLSSTLINNAAFAQAYPLLELTLTDINDKPTLRRSFSPSEYLPKGTDVSKGIQAGEEIHIKLALTASGVPVAGYRVFVTYH